MDNIQEEIEDKIIDYINVGATGRLIISKPEKSPIKADLIAERRGKYKENKMYFQINTFVRPAGSKVFIKEFLQEGFKAENDFYLLFVCFDEVEQKINDNIWLVPSSDFRDVADVTKSVGGKKFLKFEAVLDSKNADKYSKFVINIKDIGKLILAALENKGKFDFKEDDFDDKKNISIASLKEFISEARRNTYAAGASHVDNPRLLSSVQLEFQRGDYFYRDIYFQGEKKFIGQEIVYQDLRPIWGMNYEGNAIGKLEASFLKESLLNLSEKCRLGQNCEYIKREHKYQDKGQGSLEDFSGQEEILLEVTGEHRKIYKLEYRGGLI